jgi:hypothetical protein
MNNFSMADITNFRQNNAIEHGFGSFGTRTSPTLPRWQSD